MIRESTFQQLVDFYNIKASSFNSWQSVLASFDDKDVSDAINFWINNKNNKPTPADLVEIIKSYEKNRLKPSNETKEEKIKRFYYMNKKYNKHGYILAMEFKTKESYITYPVSNTIAHIFKEEGFEEKQLPFIDENGELHPFKILFKKYVDIV